ncbi:hypothetical protein EYC98_07740 [Halieaceae bacterium IMCC14734]|uniref:VPLPA-CTERM sorting domain-containing protein n=1 Tax=Candidatus Litorirhabdus singularis TaxID=2518993 RepID=A0ABT3TEU4_9GAMM|nr:hypothetical protein [Candidatus Litorirhabdus singularis]MCX2980769.1 hypothetical protein [Candidatus Litorirhabdus singularis]
MKTVNVVKKISSVVLSLMMGAGISLSVSAAQISAGSEMAFFGTYVPTGGTDLTSATGLAFPAPVTIAAGANDFAFAASSLASFSGFGFNPATAGPVLTFSNGGAFTAANIVTDVQTAQSLDLTLVGTWSLNGFDDTIGSLIFTADALGGLYTFSAAGTVANPAVVPLPGAMLFFASALAGLGVLRRPAAKTQR